MNGHMYSKSFCEVLKFFIFYIFFHLKKFKFRSKWMATYILSHSVKFWNFWFFDFFWAPKKIKISLKVGGHGYSKQFCEVLKFLIFLKKFKNLPIFLKSIFFIFLTFWWFFLEFFNFLGFSEFFKRFLWIFRIFIIFIPFLKK